MTITAIGYSIFALFRPAIYKFSTLLQERALAKEIVAKHGRDSQDFFKLWHDKSYFFSLSKNCFLAYRVGANFAVALADPVGPEEEIEETIRGFTGFCKENDWGLGFHQVLPDFLPLYTQLGFRKLKIGDDAIVDLTHFTLEGSAGKEFRHTVNKMEKSDVRIMQYEPPIPEDVLLQVKEVSDEWLQIPGRRERGFTLGMFEPNYIKSTPVFSAVDKDGKMLAFVNIIPSYRQEEATIDLMRRRTEAPNGIMDYLFVKLFLYNKEKGYKRFSLGMAPMSGFQENEEASMEEKAIHYFFQHLNFLFSFTGLRQYKAKFATFWEPRYTVYQNPLDLPRLAIAMGRVSELDD
jgi:phosphatidylglycerol lysyltransferase